MSQPYPTGCNSHCNDCTETTHCRVVDKSGHVLPKDDMKEVTFPSFLIGFIAVSALAGAIVTIALSTLANVCKTFFLPW